MKLERAWKKGGIHWIIYHTRIKVKLFFIDLNRFYSNIMIVFIGYLLPFQNTFFN